MTFEPIRTERLLLRQSVMGDLAAAIERRSLPQVAKFQDWELPYDEAHAKIIMAKLEEMDGPVDGSGWSLTVVDAAAPEKIMGDLYVGIEWGGRSAEVGFTFHPDYWGKGYASEATQAIVRYLFTDFGVSRVRASMDPANHASARVLEGCGMLFEGRTRQSFWVGDECTDDVIYGMTRTDWNRWVNRSRQRPNDVRFLPVTPDNVEQVAALATHKSQEHFVAPVAQSFEDALMMAGSDRALWYRAIEADGDIVGFIMAQDQTDDRPDVYLGRLLIDRMHQRRGIGSAALDHFVQKCRDHGAAAVSIQWGEGPGSPAPLYLSRGFEPTGEMRDGEVVAVKQL